MVLGILCLILAKYSLHLTQKQILNLLLLFLLGILTCILNLFLFGCFFLCGLAIKLTVNRFQPLFVLLLGQSLLVELILSQYLPFLVSHYLDNLLIDNVINIFNVLLTYFKCDLSPKF